MMSATKSKKIKGVNTSKQIRMI